MRGLRANYWRHSRAKRVPNASLITLTPGQPPLKRPFKFNGELNPSESFISHAKNRDQPRKQYEALKRGAEKLREIGAVVSLPKCNAAHAHSLLDDLIKICNGGHTRFADIHISEIGLSHSLTRELDEASIHTVADLAHSCASKLPASINLIDVVKALIAALRRVLELDQERSGA